MTAPANDAVGALVDASAWALDAYNTGTDEAANLQSARRDAIADAMRDVVRTHRILLSETAPISGDLEHWTCQVCGTEWTGAMELHGHFNCEWTDASAALARLDEVCR